MCKSPIQTLTATATVASGATIVWYDALQAGIQLLTNFKYNRTKIYYAEASNTT
jgi:hypothetical protein